MTNFGGGLLILKLNMYNEVITGLGEGNYIEPGYWIGWALSCSELLKQAYGEHSSYHKRFSDTVRTCEDSDIVVRWVEVLDSIMVAAKNDYVNGYAHDINLRISGEVYEDFIESAKATLESDNLPVAAVLATASLEDVLKRFARSHGIDTDSKTMSQVIGALKTKRGLLQRGTIEALKPLPRIRNLALHAEWDKLSEVDIGVVIVFVEKFLLKHFSREIH